MPLRPTAALSAIGAMALALAGAAHAVNLESVKLLVGELPLPQIAFQVGVSFAMHDLALVGVGDPATALKAAEARLAADPQQPQAHLDRGLALEALARVGYREEYARAAELWKPTLDARPDDLAARVGWAAAKVQLGAFDEARPVLKALAAQHPELWWPHFALAIDAAAAASSPGTPSAVAAPSDPALAHLNDALRAAANEPTLRLARLLFQWAAGMAERTRGGSPLPAAMAETSQELRETARSCPGAPWLQVFVRWATVVRALSASGAEQMSGVFRRLRLEDQRTLTEDELATAAMLRTDAGRIPAAYDLMAIYAMLHGDEGGALGWLRESVDYDPASAERWEALVAGLAQTGDLKRIGDAVAEALRHVSTGRLRCAAAKVRFKQGSPQEAEPELLAAVELRDASLPLARLMLGVVRLKRGDLDGAAEQLRLAAEAWTEDGQAEAALALTLALAGKAEEASSHLAKARKLSPNEALYQRAAEALAR